MHKGGEEEEKEKDEEKEKRKGRKRGARAYWHNPSQAESHHAIILLNLPQFSANGMVFQMLFNVKVKLFWRGETRK